MLYRLIPALLTLALLGGCGGADRPSAVDVDFAIDLQATMARSASLAELAELRAQSPDVIALAGRVRSELSPYVDELAAALTRLAEQGAEGVGHEADDHSDDGSGDAQAALEETAPQDFDPVFVSAMRSALEACRDQAATEIDDGSDTTLVQLAKRASSSCGTLSGVLESLPG